MGTAWVRHADGSLTQVQPGMTIPESATIITENGARVVLGGENTPALTIAEGREFSLAPDVFAQEVDAWGSVVADPTEVAAVDPEAAQVLEALEEGMDPFELLDATAAVAATTTSGGGGNTGVSFTRLLSNVETTTPLDLNYPRAGVDATLPEIMGGTVPAAAAAALTEPDDEGLGTLLPEDGDIFVPESDFDTGEGNTEDDETDGGTAPVEPEEGDGGTDPEQPENPDPEQPENPDPEQPENPDPEQPENPDPEQPENPDPVDPEEEAISINDLEFSLREEDIGTNEAIAKGTVAIESNSAITKIAVGSKEYSLGELQNASAENPITVTMDDGNELRITGFEETGPGEYALSVEYELKSAMTHDKEAGNDLKLEVELPNITVINEGEKPAEAKLEVTVHDDTPNSLELKDGSIDFDAGNDGVGSLAFDGVVGEPVLDGSGNHIQLNGEGLFYVSNKDDDNPLTDRLVAQTVGGDVAFEVIMSVGADGQGTYEVTNVAEGIGVSTTFTNPSTTSGNNPELSKVFTYDGGLQMLVTADNGNNVNSSDIGLGVGGGGGGKGNSIEGDKHLNFTFQETDGSESQVKNVQLNLTDVKNANQPVKVLLTLTDENGNPLADGTVVTVNGVERTIENGSVITEFSHDPGANQPLKISSDTAFSNINFSVEGNGAYRVQAPGSITKEIAVEDLDSIILPVIGSDDDGDTIDGSLSLTLGAGGGTIPEPSNSHETDITITAELTDDGGIDGAALSEVRVTLSGMSDEDIGSINWTMDGVGITPTEPDDNGTITFTLPENMTEAEIKATVDGKAEGWEIDGVVTVTHDSDGLSALIGSEADNYLLGTDGDDILIGGKGNDTLTGGDGDDVFKWQAGDEESIDGQITTDTITDFDKGDNTIDISELLVDATEGPIEDYLSIDSDGDNTVISIRTKGGNSAVDQKIILQGVKVADLAADGYESQSDLINSLIDQGKLNVGDI